MSNKLKKETKASLSAEMMANIDNYGNDIQSIVDDMQRVRTRPGMYIGPINAAGFLNMIREIFQNALDQMISTKSPCDIIKIVYDMKTEKVTIFDNGMGIPFDDIVRAYTVLHTSKNFTKKKGDYSAGLNGVGGKATNALSDSFVVTSFNYAGKAKRVSFSKGKVIKEEIIPNKECIQGTEIVFHPDHSIMGDTHLESIVLYTLIRDMLSLTNIGNKVDYTAIYENGKSYHEIIVNEDGIITNLIAKCGGMVIPPIIISHDDGTMKLDVAFTFDSKNIDGESITAFANMCPTSVSPLNTHVTGFLDGVCAWFVKHMNTIYLGEKSKVKVIQNDVKAGLSAMISAWHLEPQFTGQAKEQFSNADFKPFAKQVIMNGLDEWSKKSPQELQKVCKFLKEVAEIRMKTDSEKVKITAKYAKSVTTGLPEKYRRPTGPASLGWELFIVEGDSAESSASTGRDETRQGIFPIRGKILNVFDATAQEIANNAEIMGIKDILGAGFGNSFDVSKVKFTKIIFLTDADADGNHITALLLLLFIRFFPGLVESGMVYKAVPPLYGIRKEKSKPIFFNDRIAFAKFMQKKFYNDHKVQFPDGTNITPTKFTNILLDNDEYTDVMGAITNRYKIDPNLLEIVLTSYLQKDSLAKLKKKITTSYRFLHDDSIDKTGSTIKIKGLVNQSVQTVFYNERFIQECKHIIPYIQVALSSESMSYLLDGKEVGLYTLINTAEISANVGIERYKGLGEMDGKELGISTMLPEGRLLIQYTTDDIKKDIEIIRSYQSDKKKILAKITGIKKSDLIE